MTVNFAHRGASGYYPENTMSAFKGAIKLGCGAIETDVQLTSDNVLVLIHDEKVDRTTNGRGFVKDFSYKELRKLDAGSWYSSEYKNEYIPRAEDLLELAKQKNISINFELKTGIIQYPGIEKKLIELVHKYNMNNKIILSSFNHYSMVTCKTIDKTIKTGLLYEAGLYKASTYCKFVGADALHPNFHAVDSTLINEAHNCGLTVNAYTVNTEEDMKKLLKLGIDGIITNYPDKLKRIIKIEG